MIPGGPLGKTHAETILIFSTPTRLESTVSPMADSLPRAIGAFLEADLPGYGRPGERGVCQRGLQGGRVVLDRRPLFDLFEGHRHVVPLQVLGDGLLEGLGRDRRRRLPAASQCRCQENGT